jgi:glycosyltransferase involved in cell wall biosynthesis
VTESIPVISVVMPVRNGERFLAQALDSILCQTFGDFEFIVVDDGSTDATPHILADYAHANERIHVQRQEARGMVPALNLGCELARGTYLARMDADDVASPRRFAEQVSFLERHPRIEVLGAAVLVVDEHDRPLFPVWYATTNESIRRTLAAGTAFAHPVVMMRRSAFLISGGYRASFDPHAADYDLWLRMAEFCEFANLPGVLLHYRFHSGGVSFQNLSQQVLAMVGAEFSARMRRSGAPDVLVRTQPITLDSLLRMGEERDFVFSRILELSAARCGWLVRVDQADEALQLLNWAETLGGRRLAARAHAKASVMRALAWQRKGALGRSAASVVRAFLVDPPFVFETFVGGATMLLRARLPQLPIPAPQSRRRQFSHTKRYS